MQLKVFAHGWHGYWSSSFNKADFVVTIAFILYAVIWLVGFGLCHSGTNFARDDDEFQQLLGNCSLPSFFNSDDGDRELLVVLVTIVEVLSVVRLLR